MKTVKSIELTVRKTKYNFILKSYGIIDTCKNIIQYIKFKICSMDKIAYNNIEIELYMNNFMLNYLFIDNINADRVNIITIDNDKNNLADTINKMSILSINRLQNGEYYDNMIISNVHDEDYIYITGLNKQDR